MDVIVLFQGKVFPKLKKRCTQGSSDSVSDKEEDEATDYVFRIVFPNSQSEFGTTTRTSYHFYRDIINLKNWMIKAIPCPCFSFLLIHLLCTSHWCPGGFTEIFWLITVTVTQSSQLSQGTALLSHSVSLNSRGRWPPKCQTLVMPKGESASSPKPSCNSPRHLSFTCSYICLSRHLEACLCPLLLLLHNRLDPCSFFRCVQESPFSEMKWSLNNCGLMMKCDCYIIVMFVLQKCYWFIIDIKSGLVKFKIHDW